MHSHQNLIRLPDPLGWEALFHLQSIQTFKSVKEKCMGNFSSRQIALSSINDAQSSTILWLQRAFFPTILSKFSRGYPLYQYIFELCPQHVPDSLHLYSRAPLLLLLYCIPLFSSGCITRSQKNKTMLSIYSHFLFNDIKGPLDKFSCEYIRISKRRSPHQIGKEGPKHL